MGEKEGGEETKSSGNSYGSNSSLWISRRRYLRRSEMVTALRRSNKSTPFSQRIFHKSQRMNVDRGSHGFVLSEPCSSRKAPTRIRVILSYYESLVLPLLNRYETKSILSNVTIFGFPVLKNSDHMSKRRYLFDKNMFLSALISTEIKFRTISLEKIFVYL